MSSMTLEQVRDWIRNCAVSCTESSDISNEFLGEMADAIDAHMAGMGEPVMWSLVFSERIGVNANTTFSTEKKANDYSDRCAVPDAFDPNPKRPRVVPLYTAPPIDLPAVREVIAACRTLPFSPEEYVMRDFVRGVADKLEAAIKGVA